MTSYKPPIPIQKPYGTFAIFLAGTIDQGESENWQKNVEEHFSSFPNVVLYNPRRDVWDDSWEQKIENAEFYGQVKWELNAMEYSDIIIMNFLPNSKSPISLLELGLQASSGKLIVCCPDEYWRSGNVKIVCDDYKIPFYKNLNELLLDKHLVV